MTKINQAALVELIRNAMASGALVFLEKASRGEVDPVAPLGDSFGTWPQQFMDMRQDLVEALIEERNPFLPEKPADGKHSFQGPTDIGGNSRCTFCGAYQYSDEADRPCEGEYKESGKMRVWAARRWQAAKEAEQ